MISEKMFLHWVFLLWPGVKMAVDAWVTSPDLDGIIGATCSVVCQPVALLAAAWNIPMVSNLCSSGHLSNKTVYPTFSRSVGTWIKNSFTLDAMMDAFRYLLLSLFLLLLLLVLQLFFISLLSLLLSLSLVYYQYYSNCNRHRYYYYHLHNFYDAYSTSTKEWKQWKWTNIERIMYVLEWWTVSALTRGLLWCLFPELLRNEGNKHKNNSRVTQKQFAEYIHHFISYTI